MQSIVSGDRYEAQLSDRRFPKLARSFLCQSMLEEASGQFGRAALGAMPAAWVCDDQLAAKDQAADCRGRAVELIRDASRRGQQVMTGIWTGELLIGDLLRRSKAFEAAAAEARRALALQPEPMLRSIFEYEASRIQARDPAGRSLADVIRWAPAAWGVVPAAPKSSVRKVAEAATRGILVILLLMIGPLLLAAAFLLLVAVVAIGTGLDRLRASGKRLFRLVTRNPGDRGHT